MGNHISHKTFSLNNVPYSGMIEGKTFEDCHILGPAVIHHSGQTSFYDCIHDLPVISNPENTVYTVIPDHGILGVLPMNNCVFRRCKFSNISFVGNEQAGEIMKRQIRDHFSGNA